MQIFKPVIDTRYADDHIVSHSDMRIASRAVATAQALLAAVEADTEVIGVDEGQFFDHELPLRRSNVMLVCPSCDKATRTGRNDRGARVCRKCGSEIDK